MLKRLFWILLAVVTAISSPVIGAESVVSSPILTVTSQGADDTAEASAARFDLDRLAALGEDGFTTSTIWTEGTVRFTGVRLSRLVSELEIDSGKLELLALNDYLVELDVAEALESEALIAYRMNGDLISPRNKGPLWLVYPYDKDVKFQADTYYARSIWQLNRIVVYPADQ